MEKKLKLNYITLLLLPVPVISACQLYLINGSANVYQVCF